MLRNISNGTVSRGRYYRFSANFVWEMVVREFFYRCGLDHKSQLYLLGYCLSSGTILLACVFHSKKSGRGGVTMAQALPELVIPRKPFIPTKWVSPSLKPRNLFELVLRQPNYGIGARYTHEKWLTHPNYNPDKPTYWTVVQYLPRKKASSTFLPH